MKKKCFFILILSITFLSCVENEPKTNPDYEIALEKFKKGPLKDVKAEYMQVVNTDSTYEIAQKILYKVDSVRYFNALKAYTDHKYEISITLLNEIDSMSHFYKNKTELLGMINLQIKEDPNWQNYIKNEDADKFKIENSDSQFGSYTFVLTHALGMKLNPKAYLTVGNHKNWKLDMGNNDIINYNIISMNKDNLMCGIRAQDSFGDYADICITKKEGNKTSVEIKYDGRRIRYDGYLLK